MGFSTFGKMGVATMGIAAASVLFPSTAFALGAGDNYRIGNTGEGSVAACSVNSVHTNPETGKRYMLTAGHCVDPKASDGELKEGGSLLTTVKPARKSAGLSVTTSRWTTETAIHVTGRSSS